MESPAQPFPLVLAWSPPLTHPSFRRPLVQSLPPTVPCTPTGLTRSPSSPLPRVQGVGREVPALEPVTCVLPPSLRTDRFLRPFPLRSSKARGTPGTVNVSRLQAGSLGAERGSHPPCYRPSYRAPPVMNSRVSGASTRAQPPVASRRPQHRPAPHRSSRYGFPASPGGICTPVHWPSPQGSALGTLSASPNV